MIASDRPYGWLWASWCSRQKFPPGSLGAAFIDYLTAHPYWQNATREAYAKGVGVFLSWLERERHLPPEASTAGLDRSALMAFAAHLGGRRPDILAASFRFVGWVAATDLGDARLAQRLPGRARRPGHHPARPLRAPDVERLLTAVCARSRHPLRDSTLYILYAVTACRNTEIRTLRRADLVLDGADPHVTTRIKGGARHRVPLPDGVLPVLQLYVASLPPDSHWLFPSPADPARPLAMRTVQDNLARHARVAGLDPGVRPHGFRRGAATDLAAAGAPVESIQRLLHHASIQTTQLYVAELPDRIRGVVDRLAGRLDLDRLLDTLPKPPRKEFRS